MNYCLKNYHRGKVEKCRKYVDHQMNYGILFTKQAYLVKVKK